MYPATPRPHHPQECGLAWAGSCRLALIVLAVTTVMSGHAVAQGAFALNQAPGGLTGTLVGNNYENSFGTMNALGIGTPQTGLTVSVLSNGALYFTAYQVVFTGLPTGHKGGLTTYVSTHFGHPTALIMQNCPTSGACTSSGSYTTMSTSAAAPSPVIAAPGIGNNQAVTAGLGIFLPDNDGAAAFTGTDSAVVTFQMTDLTTKAVVATALFSLNTPAATVQNALQLTLTAASGGLAVTPATDFTMNFGNVNGLGIGPGAGLSTVSAAGGIIYSTPYLINPVFTNFTSTTGSVSVYVSTNFAHPTILKLNDAASSGGPYTAISTTKTTPTSITRSAADRSSITRYLGLFVSNINGATAFTGTDNATLTFTLTVP
jgi:hypothetical protein